MSDYTSNESVKIAGGWTLVGITLFNFGVNTIIALGASIFEIYLRIKHFIRICKHKHN